MQCDFAYRNPSVLVKKKRYHAVFHKKLIVVIENELKYINKKQI